MKSLVVLLSLLTFGITRAQDYQLKVYTNYGSCKHGLKDHQGRIVWPAEFDLLGMKWHGDYYRSPKPRFWAAQKNGYFGLLSPLGEELIPFKYSEVNVYFNAITANDDQAAYLFTLEGKLIKRFEGYSSIVPHSTGYIFQKDEKYGLLDTSFMKILQPAYDRLYFPEMRHQGEGISRVVSNRFVALEKQGQHSIYNLKNRKVIQPMTDDEFYLTWDQSNCESSDMYIMSYNQEKNIKSIINSEGMEVLRTSKLGYIPIFSTLADSCGLPSIQLAYLEENRKMRILNIKTGAYSNEHEEIYPLHGYSIFFDNKKWGVIYPDFRESNAYSQPKYELEDYIDLETAYKHSIAADRYSKLFTQNYSSEKIDSVLITHLIVEASKKNKKRLELYGLFNFRTGKRIKQKYHRIERRHIGNQTVYWAFIYGNPHGPYYQRMTEQLDVYSSDLTLLNRWEHIESVDFDHYRERKNYNVIIERDGLLGITDAFGNEIAPIHYKEISIASLENHHKGSDPYFFYLCSLPNEPDASNSRKGLLAKDGEIVIPFEYYNIYIQNNLIFGWRGKESSDIYTIEGKPYCMNATAFVNHREVKKDAQCIGKSYNDPLLHTYIVKDDKLYHSFQGKLELYNEDSFDFSHKYCYFLEWIVIDQNAHVISSEPVGLYRRRSYHSNDFVTDCSTFLDEYPIPVQQPNVQSPPKKIEKQPTHQWKTGPKNDQTKWYLYTPEGDLKYKQPFDFPTTTNNSSYKIFRRNGKYGRFDRNFNIVMEAKYDFISQYGELARIDSLWYARNPNSNEWSQGYDAISDDQGRHLRFVFLNGKIGIINDSLEFILPLTDSAAFIQKFDLVKTLNLHSFSKKKRPYPQDNLIYNGTPADLYRRINNFHLVEEAYYNSTANKTMAFCPVDTKHPDLSGELTYFKLLANKSQKYLERVPTYYNQYFYSEITYTRNTTYYGSYLDARVYAYKDLYNYQIVKNQLVPITLSDILKSDAQSKKLLHQLLIRETTKIQAYGDNCVDIESKLEELKSNFLISGSRIIFFSSSYGGFEISLHFNELKPVFRYPQKMIRGY